MSFWKIAACIAGVGFIGAAAHGIELDGTFIPAVLVVAAFYWYAG